jgi:hypothetical protein
VSISTNSVEPPPMSKREPGPSPGSSSRVAAEHRQPRLFLGRDDVERDAGLAVDALDELRPLTARRHASVAPSGRATRAAAQLLGADRRARKAPGPAPHR